MLTEALSQMLTSLGAFLPPPSGTLPQPGVSVVRLQEKQIGLGRFHAVEERNFFPVVHKGLRLSGRVRFQLWGDNPEPLELQTRGLTEAVLADRDALEAEGFVELNLTAVSTTDHLAALPAWRQTAEFDVLYEFRKETSDLAGGLIARVPTELREAWGSFIVTGDVRIWDSEGTPALALKGRGPVLGIATLEFLETAAPAGAVTITRTTAGATGAPTAFGTLAGFLAGVAGPEPASTHARVSFPTLADFLTALGPAGDPTILVDETGSPREFPARAQLFDIPIELGSQSDIVELAFEAPQMAAGQVLYLRASRGRTPSS